MLDHRQHLGLMAAILSIGMMDMPYHPAPSGRMSYYSDPKRRGHFEKKQSRNKRRKEIAKASRKRNRH